jgi:hypothetical protein
VSRCHPLPIDKGMLLRISMTGPPTQSGRSLSSANSKLTTPRNHTITVSQHGQQRL